MRFAGGRDGDSSGECNISAFAGRVRGESEAFRAVVDDLVEIT